MSVSRKITSAAGIILAPWLFMVGRALTFPRLSRMTLAADPQYLRVLQDVGRPDHSRMTVAQFKIAAMLAAESTKEAADSIKRLLSISESQLLQDIFCAVTLDEKKDGFFVEVGVGGGQSISNTYMLEKYYGWKGLLVEPNRSSHASIASCRSATLERRAAASKSNLRLSFQENVSAGEYSRVANTGGLTILGAKIEEYEVETVTLTEALDRMGAPTEIDFLSLDTECSEIDILEGLDLNRYFFKVMVIEHNHNREIQNKLEAKLSRLGYRLVFPHISGFDAWYVHQGVDTKSLRLSA